MVVTTYQKDPEIRKIKRRPSWAPLEVQRGALDGGIMGLEEGVTPT